MRKISQALISSARQRHHGHRSEGPLSKNRPDGSAPPTPNQPDYDALLHRRKSISGSEFAGVGVQFGVTIVVFALAGIWLDKKLGTSPWLVLVMVFGGAGLGFWSMVRKLSSQRRRP